MSSTYVTSSGSGKREPEGASLARDAVDPDRALHGLDEVLDDREAEAGAAHVPRATAVDAVKALEEARQVAGLDAGAGVRHLDVDLVFAGAHADGDGRARGAVLDRVVDQIGEHLLDGAAIGPRDRDVGAEVEREAEALPLGLAAQE